MTTTPTRHRRKFLGRLGERLLADGLIPDATLREALEMQRHGGGFLGEILVTMGALTPHQIRSYLEDVTGFPFVDVSEIDIDRELPTRLPESIVVSRRALPFREEEGHVLVAMSDPLNLAVVDEIKATLGKPVIPYLALSADLDDAIKRIFDVHQKTRSVLDQIGSEAVVEFEDPLELLLAQVEDAPLVRLVNNIIGAAVGAGASDIHIEPQEMQVRVRFRIDGVMYEQMTIPSNHLAACVSRLKVMSNLDIAERRRPQDGRFTTRDEQGDEFDIRLSIMPTVYGEKACMRLLEKSNALSSLDKLGFQPEQKAMFERFIRRPYGLILVTGPTGSGKSTTLYAALNAINKPGININTIEDPVEYKLSGINQMQVNPKIGLSFANGLRTLVRQDPDVILVGEIRDRETAEIAVQAALTGHLVLSTLHTNDAPGAIIRLRNMGIEPFLITSALIGVIGQRLLRCLCPNCREPYTPEPDEARAFGVATEAVPVPTLARSVGCKRCGKRGMRGRTAAMEIFPVTETIRSLILADRGGSELAALAKNEGMQIMRESAIQKALDLQISIEEVLRIFATEE